jgi:DNA-directed RNA polymerase specialized sigma24 family protein
VTAEAAEFGDDVVDRCTAQLVGGDRAAYELLFRRRVAFVEAESLRILGRRHDLAADAAQDAWLRVARAPRRCATSASLDAWLRRIVRSAAIDLLRSELARRCRERRRRDIKVGRNTARQTERFAPCQCGLQSSGLLIS